MIKKIRFYKELLVEILATLIVICSYLDESHDDKLDLMLARHLKYIRHHSNKLMKALRRLGPTD